MRTPSDGTHPLARTVVPEPPQPDSAVPRRDADGHCPTCGEYVEPPEVTLEHECPPGFVGNGRKLKEMNDGWQKARTQYYEAVMQRLQPGMQVHVRHGDNEVLANVIATLYWGGVLVRSYRSQKEYHVDVTRLVEFDRL